MPRMLFLASIGLLFLPRTGLSQEPWSAPYADQYAPPAPGVERLPPYMNSPPAGPYTGPWIEGQAQPPIDDSQWMFDPAQAAPGNQGPPSLPHIPGALAMPEAAEVIVETEAPVTPAPGPPAKIWEGNVELGVNGSDGNTETFNLHFGAKLKRETELNILSSELDYRKNTADSVETANKAFLDSRFERLFPESPWTWFIHNTEEYDEFTAYDLRVAVDTGFGYQFIDIDTTSLIGRLGGGTSREIGGPNDDFVPEAVFGLEGEHQLTKRQKLCASVEYRPDVTDFADYRLNAKADWEVLLDEEMNLSMKAGVIDRYDSSPEGLEPNDLDYTLTLLWGF